MSTFHWSLHLKATIFSATINSNKLVLSVIDWSPLILTFCSSLVPRPSSMCVPYWGPGNETMITVLYCTVLCCVVLCRLRQWQVSWCESPNLQTWLWHLLRAGYNRCQQRSWGGCVWLSEPALPVQSVWRCHLHCRRSPSLNRGEESGSPEGAHEDRAARGWGFGVCLGHGAREEEGEEVRETSFSSTQKEVKQGQNFKEGKTILLHQESCHFIYAVWFTRCHGSVALAAQVQRQAGSTSSTFWSKGEQNEETAKEKKERRQGRGWKHWEWQHKARWCSKSSFRSSRGGILGTVVNNFKRWGRVCSAVEDWKTTGLSQSRPAVWLSFWLWPTSDQTRPNGVYSKKYNQPRSSQLSLQSNSHREQWCCDWHWYSWRWCAKHWLYR